MRRSVLQPIRYRDVYTLSRIERTTSIATSITRTSVRRFVDFCAFYRSPKSDEGYVLSREEILAKIAETIALGGNQILMQGGLHPKFKLDWYEELLRDIKRQYPTLNIHGFSPPEIYHFSK